MPTIETILISILLLGILGVVVEILDRVQKIHKAVTSIVDSKDEVAKKKIFDTLTSAIEKVKTIV